MTLDTAEIKRIRPSRILNLMPSDETFQVEPGWNARLIWRRSTDGRTGRPCWRVTFRCFWCGYDRAQFLEKAPGLTWRCCRCRGETLEMRQAKDRRRKRKARRQRLARRRERAAATPET